MLPRKLQKWFIVGVFIFCDCCGLFKKNKKEKLVCAGRESNSGLVRGRDVYYHCTTGADVRVSCSVQDKSFGGLGVAIRRPDCVSDKQEAMAQRQRVGFQTRRLGVRIPLASFFFIFVRGNQTQNQKKRLPKLGIAPRLPRPQRGVLLLDYFGSG